MHEAAILHEAWTHAMRHGDFTAAHDISAVIRRTIPAPPPDTTPRHLQRVWTGEPVGGRRVLVRCHHGLGDTLQFARFLPPLAEQAHTLIVYAQATLLPLLRTMRMGTATVEWETMGDDEPRAERDMDVEIMELLQLLGPTMATLPRTVPYLHVPAAPRTTNVPTVGIVWSVGRWASHRSMRIDDLAPLFDVSGIVWRSLQHDTGVPDPTPTPQPSLPVHHARPVWCTAREMGALDLVISVDSMPAHLAGALGVPVWTLLPYDADWRWMTGRDDSPWYPTMRLFRQRTPGDWTTVVADVRSALEGWHRGLGE